MEATPTTLRGRMPETQIARQDLIEEARHLLASLGEGTMSETAYDTAWVARVPNPSRPDEPLFPSTYDWLLRNQHADGSWGAEIPFAHDRLISTLAALVALASSSYRRPESEPAARKAVVYLNRERPNIRDDPHETVGFELLLPELVRQARALDLRLPYEDWAFVEAIKADKLQRIPPIALYGGPTTLTHSLEYLGDRLMPSLVSRCQGPNGSYGASPSATAYVHMLAPEETTRGYLDRVVSLSPAGGVMDVYPINVFEFAWALRSLSPIREELPEYGACVQKLGRFWSSQGVSFTDSGMVSDADDTAAAGWVLRLSGFPVETNVFALFEGDETFFCFPFERNHSVMANAAILDALKLYDSTPDHRRMTLKLAHYLRRSRHPDGYWVDKWHVSPFYATARCVSALVGIDGGLVRDAVNWVLEQQHEDGSWGVAGGNPEETAYAVEALGAAQDADSALTGLVSVAVQRGAQYLAGEFGRSDFASLWIGKGLYSPHRVVGAAVVGGLARCQSIADGNS